MNLPLSRPQWLTKAEWAVCIGATLAAIGLHLIYLTHAGGLWRDETNCVHLATLPSIGEMWRMLTHDSFPVLFPATLRFWSAIGLGGTDFGFRCLGFLIALSLLGAVWFNARVLRSSLPLVSLGLLAANLTVVRWGDSLRGYGMGSCLILLTLALVWSLMKEPGVGRFIAATLAAVLSVQCLYQNAFLLFGICMAGCFVSFPTRPGSDCPDPGRGGSDGGGVASALYRPHHGIAAVAGRGEGRGPCFHRVVEFVRRPRQSYVMAGPGLDRAVSVAFVRGLYSCGRCSAGGRWLPKTCLCLRPSPLTLAAAQLPHLLADRRAADPALVLAACDGGWRGLHRCRPGKLARTLPGLAAGAGCPDGLRAAHHRRQPCQAPPDQH